MIALIDRLIFGCWAALWLPAARVIYRRIRPWSEPLSCTTPTSCSDSHNRKHYKSCYARAEMIETTTEALVVSLFCALFWPLMLFVMGLRPLVMSATRELPEEIGARIERLERDLGMDDRR